MCKGFSVVCKGFSVVCRGFILVCSGFILVCSGLSVVVVCSGFSSVPNYCSRVNKFNNKAFQEQVLSKILSFSGAYWGHWLSLVCSGSV